MAWTPTWKTSCLLIVLLWKLRETLLVACWPGVTTTVFATRSLVARTCVYTLCVHSVCEIRFSPPDCLLIRVSVCRESCQNGDTHHQNFYHVLVVFVSRRRGRVIVSVITVLVCLSVCHMLVLGKTDRSEVIQKAYSNLNNLEVRSHSSTMALFDRSWLWQSDGSAICLSDELSEQMNR